jgi:hypothetical protein
MTRTMDPSVSVIINNYNYASLLPEAVDSALRQICGPPEIVGTATPTSSSSRKPSIPAPLKPQHPRTSRWSMRRQLVRHRGDAADNGTATSA